MAVNFIRDPNMAAANEKGEENAVDHVTTT